MPHPPPPERPGPEECCQRGCERCIFVWYEEALERWKGQVGPEHAAAILQAQLSGKKA
ncbi:MAG: oxidoreductase-like domain-containing protein [Gammaproteobacteria bacterium]